MKQCTMSVLSIMELHLAPLIPQELHNNNSNRLLKHGYYNYDYFYRLKVQMVKDGN